MYQITNDYASWVFALWPKPQLVFKISVIVGMEMIILAVSSIGESVT
jgi:hypothetical protein